ncbi:MAG TPA: tetratricopeptide repeat protein [Bacteroidota bacterium]|nr:tetratricopeptide repeat protein [Bacteroidota bacterium]
MQTHSRGKSIKKREISTRKRISFLIITLLLPIVLFFVIELCLRIFHYGPNLDLFIREQIHGVSYYTMNPDIKHRYFSQVDFTPTTSPEYFTIVKKPGTYRIFCLGASTTVGYPYWYNAAFSSFLRERLRVQFPKKDFEIINLGITATNSYSVADIARDVVNYEPDLLIVYDGHNEYYGALGVASTESVGSMRWISLLYLRVNHVKTFTLFRSAIGAVTSLFTSPAPQESRGTMMERLARGNYIPYGSEQYNDGVRIFERNLDDLISICADRGVPLILSSQVSNLRAQFPFVSGRDPVDQGGRNFRALYDEGRRLLASGQADSAVTIFNELLRMDSLRADIHFSLGQCYERLHRPSDASTEFIRARDDDQLRFRASTDINAAIRAHAAGGKNIFVDIEQAFKENSPDSLIGNNLIIEHLHPNAWGYFLMARAYAQSMRQNHLFASDDEWNAAPVVDEEKLWQDRPMTEFDERLARRKTQILTSGWPFTQATAAIPSTLSAADTLGTIVENVTRGKWDWKVGHQQAALLFEQRGEKENAAKEYEVIINQIPHDVQPYLSLAHVYLELHRMDRMKEVLLASLGVEKTILAYRALGDIALNENHPEQAVGYYESMSQFDQSTPERLQNGMLLAIAYQRSGHSDKAKSHLQLLLQLKPDYAPAQKMLSTLN